MSLAGRGRVLSAACFLFLLVTGPSAIFAAVPAAADSDSPPPARVNLGDFHPAADGSTDDSGAIANALAALPPDGGILDFPAGVYLIGKTIALNSRSNLVFHGSGFRTSTIKTSIPGLSMATAKGESRANSVVFEDLGFDIGGNSAMTLDGVRVESTRITRCRFWNGHGLMLVGNRNVTVEDCLFENAGRARYSAITIKGAASDISLKHNHFSYFKNAISIVADANHRAGENVTIVDNFFDGAWWLLVEDFKGEGPPVSYSSQGLTDRAAHFAAIQTGTTVRAMPRLSEGPGTYTAKTLEDKSAHFLRAGVRPGNIVRAGSAFAVIESVADETGLGVEGWLSDVERQPVPVPTGKYTVFGVYLGTVRASTETSLQVVRWYDFDGRTVTPGPGTRYELANSKPNYPIHCVREASNISVLNNRLRRGWSDQISIFGSGSTVAGNTVEEGQDMGIAVQYGGHNRVTGNTVKHQGTNAIVVDQSDDNTVSGNTCLDAMWVSLPKSRDTYGEIVVSDGSRNRIERNRVERISSVNDKHGIIIFSSDKPPKRSAGNVVNDNVGRNHPLSDFVAIGRATTETTFRSNHGSTN